MQVHDWDLFLAASAELESACRPIATKPLPEGVRVLEEGALPARLGDVQAFMTDQGVIPFSKDILSGRLLPACLTVLADPEERIVATGFAIMSHNRFSPFHGIAWVGLIAVAPEMRGKALGSQVDALANLAALEKLGATGTMEFVAQDNAPSRRMLETCGLRQVEGVTVTMLSRSGGRLTR